MPPLSETELEAILADARDVFEEPTNERLQELVERLRSALHQTEHDLPRTQLGTAWARLADAASLLAGRLADPTLFEDALEAYATALAITPRGNLWDKFQLNHLMALSGYARLKGDSATIQSVYLQTKEVLDSLDESSAASVRAAAEQRLAISELSLGSNAGDTTLLRHAFDRLERLQGFATSQQLHTEAVRARINQSLVGTKLAELSGDPGLLRHAADGLHNTVANLSVDSHPELWALAQKNLGQTLVRLGEFTGNRTVLWNSITIFDLCQEVWSHEAAPNRWADLQLQRALPLQLLGEMAEDPTLLLDSIDSYDTALSVLSQEATTIDWAIANMNKGNALRTLGEMDGNQETWERAISAYEAALDVYLQTDAPTRLLKTLANLAVTELLSGQRNRDAGALRRADAHLATAWEICRREDAQQLWAGLRVFRGRTAAALGDIAGDDSEYEKALIWLKEAADVFSADKISADWVGLQMQLAQLEARLGQWESVEARVRVLLDHTLEAVVIARSWQSQKEIIQLVRGAADLAASARVHLGDPIGAWKALFAGRGILRAAQRASEMLVGRETAQASKLRAARSAWIEASDALELSQRFSTSGNRSEDALERTKKASQAFAEATAMLKSLQPELERETVPADSGPSSPEGRVVWAALLVTDLGGAVLIRQKDGDVLARDLPRLSTANLETLLSGPATPIGSNEDTLEGFEGWMPAYQRFKEGGVHPSNRRLHAWNNVICRTLNILWELFAADLDRVLQRLYPTPSEIVLLPPGRMAVLPLQGARHRDQSGQFVHLMDRWSLTVAPDPGSLTVAFQATKLTARQGKILVVSPLALQPDEVPGWQALAGEDRQSLCGSEALLTSVCQQAPQADYLSLLCHGVSEPGHPEQAGLELADARLTLSRIRQLNLSGTRLVCLTACESGVVDTRVAPDEFHGLPPEFLAAGVSAVMATLWMVDRNVATDVANRFFSSHLQGATPAEALQAAQHAFRSHPHREISAAGDEKPRPSREFDQDAALLGFGGSLQERERDDTALPKDAPFYWAGFVVYGL